MIQVITGGVSQKAYEKNEYLKSIDVMMNSEKFNDMSIKEAKEKIINIIL